MLSPKNFEMSQKKAFLGTFQKFMTKQLRFLAPGFPSYSEYIGARRLKLSFRVSQPKMDILNSTQGMTLWVGRGSNP